MATSSYSYFLKSALCRIPSIFARLTYVASLRDLENDCYRDAAAGAFEPEEVNDVLRRKHLELFESWLCLSLEDQATELVAYLGNHPDDGTDALQKLRHERSYVRLIPSGALAAQRELFCSDLEIVLDILL